MITETAKFKQLKGTASQAMGGISILGASSRQEAGAELPSAYFLTNDDLSAGKQYFPL